MDPQSSMPKLESNKALLIPSLPFSCAMTGPVRSSAVKKHVQPPRPPNAWILYRSEKIRTLPPLQPGEARRAQADVSRMISEMWKNESEEERTRYERMADQKKAEHQQKYPGYRFQPQKKEEKQRLREMIKQERQTNRESRKSRGRSQVTPTFDTPTPPHFSTTFYAPETQYGPAGPSPPMSAASSPLMDNSSNPESDEQVTETIASASQEHNNGQQNPPNSVTIPPLLLDSQQWISSQPEWNSTLSTTDNTATEFVSFDVQSFQACTPQQWLPNDTSDGLEEALQAFLSATADPSIFHLNNIDVNLLTANPTGEIELSMGQVPLAFENVLSSSIPHFQTLDIGVVAGPSSHSLDALAPCLESTDSIAYNPDEFLNLDETFPSIPDPTLSETSPSSSSVSASCSNAYVPPSGAAYSSTRRVGGTWKAPPFIESDHNPLRVPAN